MKVNFTTEEYQVIDRALNLYNSESEELIRKYYVYDDIKSNIQRLEMVVIKNIKNKIKDLIN